MITNLKSLMNFYSVKDPVDEISHSYDYKNHKWYNLEFAYEYISGLNFFRRFTNEEIRDLIIPNMQLHKYTKNDIIYSWKHDVNVILVGDAILVSHKKYFTPSKNVDRFIEGDIIGYETDGSEPLDVHNWCIARCFTITA